MQSKDAAPLTNPTKL